MDLHERTADELIQWLSKSHDDLLTAEEEHARAKAEFEGIQGAVMDFVKRKGHPVEIAKKLMWKEETLLAAHEKYLEVWGKYQKAKNQKDRVDDAMRLWQSCRADIRKI